VGLGIATAHRGLEDSEGVLMSAGFYDRGTKVDCQFVSIDGATRCVPPPPRIGYAHEEFFSDASCQALLLTPERAAQPYTTIADGASWVPPYRVFAPGPAAASAAVYQKTWYLPMQGGGQTPPVMVACTPVTMAGMRQTREVSSQLFVQGTPGYATNRLAPTILPGDDGSSFHTASAAFDRSRGAACEVADDRCVPGPFARCEGDDCAARADCTEPDGKVRGDGAAKTLLISGRCPGDPFDKTLAAVATPHSCAADEAGCTCPAAPVLDFEPVTNFPRLTSTMTARQRLRRHAMTDGAGYCEPEGLPFDSTLGVDCRPEQTLAGARCVPADYVATAGVEYADAACSVPIELADCFLYPGCRWAKAYDSGAWYAVTDPFDGPGYSSTSDGSRRSTIVGFYKVRRAEAELAAVTLVTR
jgi:hypothetical protein